MMIIEKVSVQEASKKVAGGEGQLIDVREYSEFAGEHIKGARLMPISDFERFMPEIDRSKPVYLMCRSGKRASLAAEKLVAKGFSPVVVIEGGMTAWESAGLPVIKGKSKVWSLERQVRFAAGSLILAGILLSVLLHPYFVWLAAFIGAGLIFAAVSDTCGMAMALAKMPWNQAPDAARKTSAPESIRIAR